MHLRSRFCHYSRVFPAILGGICFLVLVSCKTSQDIGEQPTSTVRAQEENFLAFEFDGQRVKLGDPLEVAESTFAVPEGSEAETEQIDGIERWGWESIQLVVEAHARNSKLIWISIVDREPDAEVREAIVKDELLKNGQPHSEAKDDGVSAYSWIGSTGARVVMQLEGAGDPVVLRIIGDRDYLTAQNISYDNLQAFVNRLKNSTPPPLADP
jgi:hypothetical protein